MVPLREEPDREPPLQHVYYGHWDRGFPTQNPEGVGSSQISAAFGAEVNAEEGPPHPEAGGGGSYDVSQEDQDKGGRVDDWLQVSWLMCPGSSGNAS